MATFQRWHLLRRSLGCYARQDFPKEEFELVVIDDLSTDGTRESVLMWSHLHDIPTTVLTVAPKKEAWRDCGAILNAGIRAARGEHIILTHPEVMPGRRSVAACVDNLEEFETTFDAIKNNPMKHNETLSMYRERVSRQMHESFGTPFGTIPTGIYACCKPYYLSQRDQERIGSVDWLKEGPLAVRKIEGFYDDQPGHPDYKPKAIESVGTGGPHTHWLSWVFGGCSRRTWREIGGMLETNKWGSVDVAWVQRRRALGIVNHTCTDDDTLCVHQNHNGPNDVPTPRIEDVWKQELAGVDFNDRQAMTVDHLGWRTR